jgi:oxidase EvaA
VRLDRLAGWRHDGSTLADDANQIFTVPMVRVEAPDREVVNWDQPLVRGIRRGSVCLLCQRRDGVLQFQLRGSVEPGFAENVQFGPTSMDVVPKQRSLPRADSRMRVAASTRPSSITAS